MSEPLGTGSLSKLEELKKEHGPKAKAEAPKRRRVTQECADLYCPYLIKKIGVGRDGLWRVKGEWCSIKRCPKERAMYKYCPNSDCRWRGETDAEECPECGYPLRQPK